MRKIHNILFGAAFIAAGATQAVADEACTTAANQAMDATVAATITLATATKYATSHDDWCRADMLSLQQQDGAAVDRAWQLAIDAEGLCASDPAMQAQMIKLITSLHRRRLNISGKI